MTLDFRIDDTTLWIWLLDLDGTILSYVEIPLEQLHPQGRK